MSIVRHNYYDLVTGLPDISLVEPRLAFSGAGFMDEMSELIAPEDAQLLGILRLPVDNKNFITILESRDRPFAAGGNYPQEQLLHEIKNADTLPEYMQALLRAHREGRQLFPGLTLEDQLNWLFYDVATAHENEFIAGWFSFELHLRNVLAALSVRSRLPHLKEREPEYERCLSSCIICRNEVTEHIFKSTAPDFGLAAALPWVEYIIGLPQQDMRHREQALDRLRWDMLDGLTTFAYFQAETILAFCIKLMLVERWMKLDPVSGRQKLEQLVHEMRTGFLTGGQKIKSA